jgi:MFS family permease
MATDADKAVGDDAGRARLRFAIIVTLGFGLGQLLAWPLALMAPVLAATFLRLPAPIGLPAAIRLLAGTTAILLMGIAIVYLVLPYPLLAMLVIVLGLALTFRLGAAGGSGLTVVILLVAILILPLVGQSSPEIANLIAVGFCVNLGIAIVLSWLGFAIMPATAARRPTQAEAAPVAPTDADKAAFKMTLVVAPITVAYLAFGWSMVLTLLFSALMAQQLSAASGIHATKGVLIANMTGAAIAIVAYFLLVAVPSIPFMVVLVFAMALLFSGPVFAGGPVSDLWASAFSAVLVILGGSLTPLGEDADLKAIDRIMQIALAGIYIVGAYAIVETLSQDLRGRRTLLDRVRRSLASAREVLARVPLSVSRVKLHLARTGASLARFNWPWKKAKSARPSCNERT